jgi:lipoprotein-anchoring transpeptidase ErfK/SrfK
VARSSVGITAKRQARPREFHRGFALHAAYWHDDFGRVRSHGCVNLSPRDAAWLFEWTDPHVPTTWHSALNKERGTVVIVRP